MLSRDGGGGGLETTYLQKFEFYNGWERGECDNDYIFITILPSNAHTLMQTKTKLYDSNVKKQCYDC